MKDKGESSYYHAPSFRSGYPLSFRLYPYETVDRSKYDAGGWAAGGDEAA